MSSRYDILLNITGPTMNGFEFVREVRKINPKVKILLMTAFEIDDREFVRVLPNPKIDGLIRKHASSNYILNTVSSSFCLYPPITGIAVGPAATVKYLYIFINTGFLLSCF
jgi:DNA-binding NarL/FixJ family response regulator